MCTRAMSEYGAASSYIVRLVGVRSFFLGARGSSLILLRGVCGYMVCCCFFLPLTHTHTHFHSFIEAGRIKITCSFTLCYQLFCKRTNTLCLLGSVWWGWLVVVLDKALCRTTLPPFNMFCSLVNVKTIPPSLIERNIFVKLMSSIISIYCCCI